VARIDLADHDAVRAAVARFRPTHIVHAGALTAVGDCCADPSRAAQVNTVATGVLADAAAAIGARLVFASTDMVFAGDAAPYCESDPPRPLSVYGRSKAAAEQLVAEHPNALVVRIPLMIGLPCTRRPATFASQLAALRAGEPLRLFTDEFRTPVCSADAARALLGLARSGRTGLLHLPGPERLSRFEIIARCAALLGIAHPNLVPIARHEIAAPEPRPADLSLAGEPLGREFPDLVPGPLRAEALL
jgi:dTDP-4-dehydrorhamnose reductase